MTAVIKLATLNINAITNRKRVGMLTEYIRRHDLDIVFLQEITDPELLLCLVMLFIITSGQTRAGQL